MNKKKQDKQNASAFRTSFSGLLKGKGKSRSEGELLLQKVDTLKKGIKQKYEKELGGGYYMFEIEADCLSPSRSGLGTVVVSSTKEKNPFKSIVSFRVKGNRMLVNRFKAFFYVTDEIAPVRFYVDFFVTANFASSEMKFTTCLWKTVGAQPGQVGNPKTFFRTIGEVIDTSQKLEEEDTVHAHSRGDISPDELAQLQKLFQQFDTDGSGDLTFDEFWLLLNKLAPDITKPDANRIYSQVDTDRSDGISMAEFIDAYVYYKWDISNTSRQTQLKFEWEILYDELKLGTRLGEGAFGVVHKAKWRGIAVAVKELKYQDLNEEVLEEFRKEIAILGKLRHPNVVLFMGACTTPPHLCMVTEFLSGGNLYELLYEKKVKLNFPMQVSIGWQTALGLNYLHLSNPKILHRDFKSMNLLLDTYANVKICDFGLSCVKQKNQKIDEVVGSPLWMAPEIMAGKEYDEKADVYSFGVCLYETFTSFLPFSDQITEDEDSLKRVIKRIYDGARAAIPKTVNPEIGKLIHICWAPDPAVRPPMSEVAEALEKIHDKLDPNPLISSSFLAPV